jgi:hypothetical protein
LEGIVDDYLKGPAVIYGYGDDGADQKRERVIAVSTIIGYEQWWEQVEADWTVRCGGIPFHATDCESDTGDYEGIPHEQNKAMYRDLVGILAASPLGGIGVAIDLTAKKSVFPNSVLQDYYRAFQECISRAANVAEHLGEVVELTFDVSTENEYNARILYSFMRDSDVRLARWLSPKICFAPWRGSARVQTADLLAYEAWKALDHTVGETKRTRGSWETLRATRRFETLSYSTDWFRDLKRHIDSGELEKIVGFKQQDYTDWLKASGRTHSTSNLIHFLGSRPYE